MTHVKPARQNEMVAAMKGYKDYSVAFARCLMLKTAPPLRATRKGRKRNPWNKTARRKNDLLEKPAGAKRKHDLYGGYHVPDDSRPTPRDDANPTHPAA